MHVLAIQSQPKTNVLKLCFGSFVICSSDVVLQWCNCIVVSALLYI